MKTIGLLGGMSWESTVSYYRLINEDVRERLGGLHSAKCILHSVDFAQIEELQTAGDWQGAGHILAEASRGLEAAGAQCIVLCTNTLHRVIDAIEEAVRIPVLHIADATGEAIRSAAMRSVGLLGTRYTMEGDFYTQRLNVGFGLSVLIPNEAQRVLVHQLIFEELCLGRIRDESRTALASIVDDLIARGAEGVILGCTELGLLLTPDSCRVPLFDTTSLHSRQAVNWALASD